MGYYKVVMGDNAFDFEGVADSKLIPASTCGNTHQDLNTYLTDPCKP